MGKIVKTFSELFESESFNGGYYCSLWVTSTDPDGCHDGEMVMYAKTESELIDMVWKALDNTISTASLEGLDFDRPEDIKSILEFAEILIKISESDEGFKEGQGCESPSASLTLIEHIEDFRDLLATVIQPDPPYQVDGDGQGDDYDPDDDMSYWISFNGEIYNYLALKNELILKGYVFNTATDTEVLLHGYDAWGMGMLNKLKGNAK